MKQNQSTEVKAAERNYRMDNLKCLLIFAVVFGHMLELFMGKNDSFKVIYLVIYSFHMPLFAFISGVFARFSPEKIRNHLIYPYVVFQILYLLFANSVLEKEAEVQFTTPYWLLWYLFASIAWNLLLPLVQGSGFTWKKKAAVLSAAFLAGILIGFDNKAGVLSFLFPGSWSFFPIFCWGYIIGNGRTGRKRQNSRSGSTSGSPTGWRGRKAMRVLGESFLEERIRKAAGASAPCRLSWRSAVRPDLCDRRECG